jgi:hypothetical protein
MVVVGLVNEAKQSCGKQNYPLILFDFAKPPKCPISSFVNPCQKIYPLTGYSIYSGSDDMPFGI